MCSRSRRGARRNAGNSRARVRRSACSGCEATTLICCCAPHRHGPHRAGRSGRGSCRGSGRWRGKRRDHLWIEEQDIVAGDRRHTTDRYDDPDCRLVDRLRTADLDLRSAARLNDQRARIEHRGQIVAARPDLYASDIFAILKRHRQRQAQRFSKSRAQRCRAEPDRKRVRDRSRKKNKNAKSRSKADMRVARRLRTRAAISPCNEGADGGADCARCACAFDCVCRLTCQRYDQISPWMSEHLSVTSSSLAARILPQRSVTAQRNVHSDLQILDVASPSVALSQSAWLPRAAPSR